MTFSWRDLLVMVRRWAVVPGTALSDSLGGYRTWTTGDQLIAALLDSSQAANYYLQKIAGKKHPQKPKLLKRPWEKQKGRKIGADPIPISQFNDWWDSASSRPSPVPQP